MKKVENGHFVKMHYSGKLDSGEVFGSSFETSPLEVRVGTGQLLKGFEDALLGMAETENKTFTLSPEQAYGLRDEGLEQTFQKTDLPPDLDPKVGDVLAFHDAEGGQVPVRVKQVHEDFVVIDVNHPLAGQSLTFSVQVLEINTQPTMAGGGGCGSTCGSCPSCPSS